jgi:hypothetical protein
VTIACNGAPRLQSNPGQKGGLQEGILALQLHEGFTMDVRFAPAATTPGQKSLSIREVFCGNFYITTKAATSPTRRCCAA